MFDWWSMEQRARSALQPLDRRERELAAFLNEEEESRRGRPLRRRLAAGIVGLGLKLDPEALSIGPARAVLEAARVRD